MRFLLDTHTFLWWIHRDDRLSSAVREIISEERNKIFLSVASAWEISIKAGLGHLDIPRGPERFIARHTKLNDFGVLPIHLPHAFRVYELPGHHRDPFDRILVAQAQTEDMPMLTIDPEITRYPIETIW